MRERTGSSRSGSWLIAVAGSAIASSAACGGHHAVPVDGSAPDAAADAAAPAACEGGGMFAARATYAAGTLPIGIAIADLDGDGVRDVIVVDESAYTPGFLLFRGRGNGAFAPGVARRVGTGPDAVAVADFNGDGAIDVVVVDPLASNAYVMLGDGHGQLGSEIATPIGFGVRVDAGDFDRDGHVDLAIAEPAETGASHVRVLYGHGDGTFDRIALLEVGSNARFVRSADVDRYGNLDLLATELGNGSQPGGLALLRGHASDPWDPVVRFEVGRAPMWVATGDLDGDGVLDAVVANDDDAFLTVFRGTGASLAVQKTLPTWQPFSFPAPSSSVAIADFDGDGRADIAQTVAYSTEIGHIAIHPGSAGGGFAPAAAYVSGAMPEAVVAADLDGDGNSDVIASSAYDGTISVHLTRCVR
jgi:hypothetical protein